MVYVPTVFEPNVGEYTIHELLYTELYTMGPPNPTIFLEVCMVRNVIFFKSGPEPVFFMVFGGSWYL